MQDNIYIKKPKNKFEKTNAKDKYLAYTFNYTYSLNHNPFINYANEYDRIAQFYRVGNIVSLKICKSRIYDGTEFRTLAWQTNFSPLFAAIFTHTQST